MHILTIHITYTFYVKRLRSIAVKHKKAFWINTQVNLSTNALKY